MKGKVMPKVNGKFPYTQKGKSAAAKARELPAKASPKATAARSKDTPMNGKLPTRKVPGPRI